MIYSKQFTRKIVYIGAIAVLLIPLSLIGRPSTRDANNVIHSGGVLSQLRDENDLALTGLSEIDPAGEAMKLASLGLRGVAVNLLWLRAMEAREKRQWDDLTTTLNTLVLLQPHFIKVWEFQAHNLSYNVSVEFDDYEYRYDWVKRGIDFLTQGIDLNKRDHRIVDTLGFFSGNKFGLADERVEFRRLFRQDEDFHRDMGQFIDIDNIDTRYGPDHWLLAYEWYRLSENMVASPEVRLRTGEALYYQKRPAQLRNLMLRLQEEFRVDEEYARVQWDRAHREWVEYGRRPITNYLGAEYNLQRLGSDLEDLRRIQQRLDELAPGARRELRGAMMQHAREAGRITATHLELLDRPLDGLTDEERAIVRQAENTLFEMNRRLELDIAEQASAQHMTQAIDLAHRASDIMQRMQFADRGRMVSNYDHWESQTMVESLPEAIAARQAQYDANELRRRSILDSYVHIDPLTGERTRKPGAIQEYEFAFERWVEIFQEHPNLKFGPLMDGIVDELEEYRDIRVMAGLAPWPINLVLQPIIDERAAAGEIDDVPTSDELRELLEWEQMAPTDRFGLPPRPDIDLQFERSDGERDPATGDSSDTEPATSDNNPLRD